MIMRENAQERKVRAAARSKHNKKPLLAYVSHDFLTLTLVMRWIEFLFERLTRDKLSLVLDYYVDVGWISEDVKSEVMSYARGEMQDVTKYMAPEEIREDTFRDLASPPGAPYKKIEDWRLSADDHLKSLLFIQKIAGLEVDKDRLNSLELNIAKFKESLEGFHGV
jgi:flagellar protein FlaD